VTFTTLFFMAPLAAWANAALNSFKAPRPLVEQTHTGQPNQAIYIGCWQMEHLPSLNFYCQRDILHFQSTGEIQPFLRYPDPVYVFLHLDEWKKLKPKITVPYRELAQHRDLYRNRDIIVITNR
jgi:hypothetical protein